MLFLSRFVDDKTRLFESQATCPVDRHLLLLLLTWNSTTPTTMSTLTSDIPSWQASEALLLINLVATCRIHLVSKKTITYIRWSSFLKLLTSVMSVVCSSCSNDNKYEQCHQVFFHMMNVFLLVPSLLKL